jgi:hypothetical protein
MKMATFAPARRLRPTHPCATPAFHPSALTAP